MTEKDWIGSLSEDPVGTLPALHDWFLEQGEEGCAWLCRWLLKRSRKGGLEQFNDMEGLGYGVGPRGNGTETWWWTMPRGPGYQPDNGIPHPLGLYVVFGTKAAAWENLFAACRRVWAAGGLKEWEEV